MRVYSIYDRKLGEYGNLVLGNNNGSILRALKEGLQNQNSTMAKYPEDFDLVCVGDFNVESGELDGMKVEVIVNVGQFMKEED